MHKITYREPGKKPVTVEIERMGYMLRVELEKGIYWFNHETSRIQYARPNKFLDGLVNSVAIAKRLMQVNGVRNVKLCRVIVEVLGPNLSDIKGPTSAVEHLAVCGVDFDRFESYLNFPAVT